MPSLLLPSPPKPTTVPTTTALLSLDVVILASSTCNFFRSIRACIDRKKMCKASAFSHTFGAEFLCRMTEKGLTLRFSSGITDKTSDQTSTPKSDSQDSNIGDLQNFLAHTPSRLLTAVSAYTNRNNFSTAQDHHPVYAGTTEAYRQPPTTFHPLP